MFLDYKIRPATFSSLKILACKSIVKNILRTVEMEIGCTLFVPSCVYPFYVHYVRLLLMKGMSILYSWKKFKASFVTLGFITSCVCGRGNVFVMSVCVCVCVSVCLSVRAITFEPVDIETSFTS